MVVAFPVCESERTAEAMLQLLMENSHIDEEGIFSVPLEPWEIDLLSCYGEAEADLEDGYDDEDSDDDENVVVVI